MVWGATLDSVFRENCWEEMIFFYQVLQKEKPANKELSQKIPGKGN